MRRSAWVVVAMLASASPLAAQRAPLRESEGAVAQPLRGNGRGPGAGRLIEERVVRQRLAKRAQQVVGLTNEQMTKLAALDRDLTPRRVQLLQEEMRTRQALRRAMADTGAVDQAKIAEYTSSLVDVQRRRADLLDTEQKQLGTFMTPLQRAKYLALEERFRRMVTQRLADPNRGGAPRQP